MAVDYYLDLLPAGSAFPSLSQSLPQNSSNLAELNDFDFSVQSKMPIGSSASGAGAGKLTFNPLDITMGLNTVSNQLMQDVNSGKSFNVAIIARKASADTSSASNYFQADFKLANVTSYTFSGGGDTDAPSIKFQIQFGALQTLYNNGLSKTTPGTITTNPGSGWNQVKNPTGTDFTSLKVAELASTSDSDTSSATTEAPTQVSQPSISGTGNYSDSQVAPVYPFAGASIADGNGDNGDQNVLTLSISGSGGSLAEGPDYTTGGSLAPSGANTYTLTGTSASITNELEELQFVPGADASGMNMSTITLSDLDTATGLTSATDDSTVINVPVTLPSTSTSASASSAPSATSPGSSSSPQTAVSTSTQTEPSVKSSSDTSSNVANTTIANNVTSNPALTINPTPQIASATSTASQSTTVSAPLTPANISSVSSAVDSDGSQVFSFSGGSYFDGKGYYSYEDKISSTGAIASQIRDMNNGSHAVLVYQSSETQQSEYYDTFYNHATPDTTFVFNPGFEQDVVKMFRIGGTDHDTLSFLGSDFGKNLAAQLANLLAHTKDAKGGLVITDPTSKDTVQLSGLSKSQLVQNERDIMFR